MLCFVPFKDKVLDNNGVYDNRSCVFGVDGTLSHT